MIDPANSPQVIGLTAEDRLSVETFYRAFSGDPDLLGRAVTPNWQTIPLAPGQQPGRSGMIPLIERLSAAFPDAGVTIHEIIGRQGRASVRAEFKGTHKGEWLGISPTHRPFVMPLHDLHRIQNGRLTHTLHVEDWFAWPSPAGVEPELEIAQ